MLHYYRNPKTENLIIWDSEKNSLLILGRIEKVQVFLEDDILHPSKKDDGQVVGTSGDMMSHFKPQKKIKTGPKKISDEKIERIKEMKEEGATIKEIIKEVGVSAMTVYKYSK